MSGINWDVVNKMTWLKAEEYAAKFEPGEKYQIAFNAYHAGRTDCAGERESLRVMVERLQLEKDNPLIKLENLSVATKQNIEDLF